MLGLVRPLAGPRMRGMTLIELMIGLTIVAVVLMLGMPSMAVWMKNSRIRTAADSLHNSMQAARAEAVRRNQVVRVQVVDSLNGDCSLSSSGHYWVMSLGSASNPASSCASAIDDSTAPKILQKGAVTNTANITINASQTVFAFNGLGQQASTTEPTTTAPQAMTVQITAADSSCVQAGGEIRCLNISVSPAGQVRMCDPAISTAGDALKC